MGNTPNSSGSISKETFKKLFLLYIVSKFQRGVFGKKRLHKIVYIIERESDLKPFEFKKYHYGEYSDPLDDIQDQLLSMGYLVAAPLDTKSAEHSGNIFELADKDLEQYYSVFMEKINPQLKEKIDTSIRDYGYLPESELLELAYSFPEFVHAGFDSLIFPEQMPARFKIEDVKEEDIEELEISLNPRFINLLNQLDNAFEQSEFDPKKVKKVVKLI